MALLGKFFGNTVGQGAAFAIGRATAPTLHPVLQSVANEAWTLHPDLPISAGTLALGVAQGQIPSGWAKDEALRTGVDNDRFGHLVDAASTGPGVPVAFDLWRRGELNEQGFRRAAKRQGLEAEWIDGLVALKDELLDPGQLAAAIHRGLVPDPGLLKGEQPEPPFSVEAYPVYPIPTLDEAAGSGYTKDRLGVLVGLQGLPMGVIEAAHAYFRKIITHGDYIRAFNTSNSRNEWAAAVLEYARQIPTARDFFENALRGYHSFDWAVEQAKRHGMTEADATVIYQNQGRPMNVRQITQALSRGGKFKPEAGEITDPYRAAIIEGNLKPAYYDLADALKYTLPSPFVMKSLTQSGTWSEAKAAQRLKDAGWIPSDADEAAADWAKGTGDGGGAHVKKAQTQLWGTLHRAYMAGDASEATAREKLPQAGVPAGEVAGVLVAWNHEREVQRQRITPAQLKKALAKAVQNPATGQPWTKDEVLAELLSRGWSSQDANTYLDT